MPEVNVACKPRKPRAPLSEQALANIRAAALRREANKRSKPAPSAPTIPAAPPIPEVPLPVAPPHHKALLPVDSDTPKPAPAPAPTPAPSIRRRASLQEIGITQTDIPELREALSLMAQDRAAIDRLRGSEKKLLEERTQLTAEVKELKRRWELVRADANRFQMLLGQIGEAAGVFNAHRLTATTLDAVKHLRERADRALELEEKSSEMNVRAHQLEAENAGLERSRTAQGDVLMERNKEISKLGGELATAKDRFEGARKAWFSADERACERYRQLEHVADLFGVRPEPAKGQSLDDWGSDLRAAYDKAMRADAKALYAGDLAERDVLDALLSTERNQSKIYLENWERASTWANRFALCNLAFLVFWIARIAWLMTGGAK